MAGKAKQGLAVVPDGDGFALTVDGILYVEGDGETVLRRDSVIEVVNDAKTMFGSEAVVDESAVTS